MQIKASLKKRWVGLGVAALMLSGVVGFVPTRAIATSPADPTDFVSSVASGHLALQLRTDSSGVVSGKVLQYDASPRR